MRHKTTQRTLFLSFEINNCFQIVSEVYEKIRETYKPRARSNNAIHSLPTFPISLGIVALFDGEPILTVISVNVEYVLYRCFS